MAWLDLEVGVEVTGEDAQGEVGLDFLNLKDNTHVLERLEHLGINGLPHQS